MILATILRKPTPLGYAKNVLTHQTGGLNIDPLRVLLGDGMPKPTTAPGWDAYNKTNLMQGYRPVDYQVGVANYVPSPLGRWPTNVMTRGFELDPRFFRKV